MKRGLALLLGTMLLSGCLFGSFDDSDQMVAADKSVPPETLTRVTSHLLDNAPAIREQKARLLKENDKVKLTLSIIAAPDPNHTKNDPDYRYHANYYWVYANYRTKDKLLKYDTYLVHKDLSEVLFCDTEKDDAFVKVAPRK